MLIPGSPSCWSLYRLSGGTFLMALACTLPGGASAANVGAYIAVAPGNSQPTPNSFEVFNSTNIAARVDVPEPSFRAQFSYSGRDWEEYSEPPRSKRIPTDPNRFQHIVFSHRTVPAALSLTFEHVESAADADPVTLAKILRYNREAGAKFRVLSESQRRVGGVDGMQTEYVELRHKKLMRVRHWTAHYNGFVYQLQLIVPYEHPELLGLGSAQGFPVVLDFFDQTRTRPLLKDSNIPRHFDSHYGYQVDLGEGEWIPDGHDAYIPLAEYVAYTRNQGGIAVVPFGALGLDVEPAALVQAIVWLGELPTQDLVGRPSQIVEGNLHGMSLELLSGDEEEMIRMRAKAVYLGDHAYLAVAWVNTNSPLGPEALDKWLSKISVAQEPALWPTNAQSLLGLREKDREALGFLSLGGYYYARKDFDRSAAALHNGMECRFFPQILSSYASSEHRRGHPEEIVNYVKTRGPFAMREGWVVLELAFAESRCGDYGKAAAHYSQCIASCGYPADSFPPDCFEDYIRCLIKSDRMKWATDRLKQRIAIDPSPVWKKMLAELTQAQATGGDASASKVQAAVSAPVLTGPPRLKNIIWNPSLPSAQLDQNLAFEGDKVRGYKVMKILQNSVALLTPEGTTLTLRPAP